jgi:sigma-B regulation protein RsbU (phosphoserine phosphatase)
MPLRILIADDEEDLESLVLQKFRKRIASGELQFSFARNGQEALQRLLRDEAIGIVFCDINMPVMDGLTLLSELAAVQRPLKVIMVSAYDDLQNIRTAMNRGAFDFLTKPIDFDDFENTLRKTESELLAIRESIAAKERLSFLQSELALASRIQQSILPTEFPNDPRFEVYAQMSPARVVSGDFYDFFPLDDRALAFAIGDVSGKGIPAGIFMAVSRTLLRGSASLHTKPEDTLRIMNDILVRQGPNEMFVTVFYGILDTGTGRIEFAVAGQPPPQIVRYDGRSERLHEISGTMIGLLEEPIIGAGSTTLCPGDTIFVFTDGICDAENALEEPFTEERLTEALNSSRTERNGKPSAKQMVQAVFQEINSFCGEATQFDDITALALQLRRN